MTTSATIPAIERNTCVVRDTAAVRGRTRSVEPGKTAARHLNYGRIILAGDDSPVKVDPGGLETALICLKGEGTVAVAGTEYRMSPYDALYVPRNTSFEVRPSAAGCDFAEIAAAVEQSDPVQFV